MKYPRPPKTRVLALLGLPALVVVLVTCVDLVNAPKPPGSRSTLAFAPAFTSSARSAAPIYQAAGLQYDAVRVIVSRNDQTLADTTVDFRESDPDLDLDLRVDAAVGESLKLVLIYLAGTIELYRGESMITTVAIGSPPGIGRTTVNIEATGPGATAARVEITPASGRFPTTAPIQFTALAFDASGSPIENALFGWEVDDAEVATIDASGMVQPTPRGGALRVTARTLSQATAQAEVTLNPQPAGIIVVSGGGQSGVVGSALPQPMVVEVRGASGVPVADQPVEFTASGGSVEPVGVATDPAGRAQTTMVLGTTPGTYTYTATAGGFSVPVTATAVAGAPALVNIVSGDGQRDTVRKALPAPLVVRVTDAHGNPRSGITVTWARTAGDGTLSATSTVTGADGLASVTYTLGSRSGVETITASASGIGTPAAFTATALAGEAASLTIVSGNDQTGAARTPLALPLVIEVLDAFDNPVTDLSVSWQLSDASSSLQSTQTATGDNGWASTGVLLGGVPGQITVTASAAGRSVVFNATVTPGAPAQLMFETQPTSALAGAGITPAPSVAILDQDGNLTDVTDEVTLEIQDGTGTPGATLMGTVTVAAVDGVATFPGLSIAMAGAGYRLRASAGFGDPVESDPFNITAGTPATLSIFDGDNQTALVGTAVPVPPAVIVRDDSGIPVPGVQVEFGVESGGGSITGANAVTDANGVARVGSWTLGTAPGINLLVAGVSELDASVTFTATGSTTQAAISLALAGGATFVGVDFSASVQITLNVPAPTGGLVVTVVSSDPTLLSVAGNGQVAIAAGATQGAITVHGLSAGTPTLTATAPDYNSGTLQVPVSLRLISLPASVNVPFGLTASVPIQIAEPAPTGGLTVSVVSSDPTKVTVNTPTVTIAAGGTLASATVAGTLPGTVTLTASAPGFISSTTPASTTANLDIIESSISLSSSFGNTFTVRLQSAGLTIAAPAGGITVNLSSTNQACVAVPGTVVIPAGLTQVTVTATYAGSATLPCSAQVTASATNIVPDVVNINVSVMPTISLSTSTVGEGLQRQQSLSLSTTVHGGVTVRITSTDPNRVLVSPNASTAGTDFIDVFIASGSNFASYFVQGAGAAGTTTITGTATGFANASVNQPVAAAWIDLVSVPTSTTLFSGDSPFQVRVGIGSAAALSELQAVRAGGSPLPVTVTSADDAVLRVVDSQGASSSAVVHIQPQANSSPGTVLAGGLAIRPIALGTTTVAGTSAAAGSTSNATRTVIVASPSMSASLQPVGDGLQRVQTVSLAASLHGGITVRVASTDPDRLLVAPNVSTAGSAEIDIVVLNGTTSFNFVTQVISGATGSVPLDITSPLFTPFAPSLTIVPARIDVQNLPSSTTTAAADIPFTVRLGIGSATSLSELQAARAGGPGYSITVASTDPSVATLVTSLGVSGSVSVSIQPQANASAGTVASGGVALRPLQAGTTTISATGAGLVPTSNATRVVPVTAGTFTQFNQTVGAGLQRQQSVSLSGGNHGGITVRLTSADPSILLLAPNVSTAGTAFIDIAVPNGTTNFTYFAHGVNGQAGSIQVSAAAPGFTTSSGTVPVVQPFLDIVNLQTSTTTLASDMPFSVRVGLGSQFGLSELQAARAGAAPLSVTLTSSTAAGQLVTSSTVGGSATISIAPQANSSPASVAAGGVAFRAFSAGVTEVTATSPGIGTSTNGTRTVTVSSPGVTLNATTVGAGLMQSTPGSLSSGSHGGTTVRISSSHPSVALVSANTATAGTAFVDIPLAAGVSNFSYVVHGVEGATGTVQITAVAPGFTDGSTTSSIVTPFFDITGVPTTANTATNQTVFNVRVGIGTASSLSSLQSVRAGAAPLNVTVTTTNGSVVALTTSSGTGAVAAVTIAAGASSTPGSVAAGGVAFNALAAGTATITATIPGMIATANAVRPVTVSQATFSLSSATVGGGLQTSTSLSLSGGNHGGVTVRVTSTDPSRLLISPNSTTEGTASATFVVPNGSSFVSYFLHGVEGQTGQVEILAELVDSDAFAPASTFMNVVQPALQISGLATSPVAEGADDPFNINIGVANTFGTAMSAFQSVRAGSAGLTVTITSSMPSVGVLVTTSTTGPSVTVSIGAGANSSPGTVATGGVAFRPLVVGSTTVAASIPGFLQLPAGSVTVVVQ